MLGDVTKRHLRPRKPQIHTAAIRETTSHLAIWGRASELFCKVQLPAEYHLRLGLQPPRPRLPRNSTSHFGRLDCRWERRQEGEVRRPMPGSSVYRCAGMIASRTASTTSTLTLTCPISSRAESYTLHVGTGSNFSGLPTQASSTTSALPNPPIGELRLGLACMGFFCYSLPFQTAAGAGF